MRKPGYTTQFDRDVKRMRKRGKDLDKLKAILSALVAEKSLEPRYRDHPLRGDYRDRRGCHIEPDWLLVYKLEGETDIIFERTGTHSDLFG